MEKDKDGFTRLRKDSDGINRIGGSVPGSSSHISPIIRSCMTSVLCEERKSETLYKLKK